MWADINTKALQGTLFYKMRARLVGVDGNYGDNMERQATHASLLSQEAHECKISVTFYQHPSSKTKKLALDALLNFPKIQDRVKFEME